MPKFNVINSPLSAEMSKWNPNRSAVVLIDEFMDKSDVETSPMGFDYCRNQQIELIRAAARYNIPVCLSEMMYVDEEEPMYLDFAKFMSETSVKHSVSALSLAREIPASTPVYKKTINDSNGMVNKDLCGFLAEKDNVVVMGKVRCACCQDTAAGIKNENENCIIHTTLGISRLGSSACEEGKDYFYTCGKVPFKDGTMKYVIWPPDVRVYAQV